MTIPALDKTGTMYEASRFAMGADVYYLMISYTQIQGGGVQFTDYITARLFKNADRSNSLFPANVGGKIEMALDNLGNQTKSLKERWNNFVQRLSVAIDALNITSQGGQVTDMQQAWDMSFGLALYDNNGKLGLVDVSIP